MGSPSSAGAPPSRGRGPGRQYTAALRHQLESIAGWSRAESEPVLAALAGGRRVRFPAGLYRLHRDLTGLRRAHAGASW